MRWEEGGREREYWKMETAEGNEVKETEKKESFTRQGEAGNMENMHNIIQNKARGQRAWRP